MKNNHVILLQIINDKGFLLLFLFFLLLITCTFSNFSKGSTPFSSQKV